LNWQGGLQGGPHTCPPISPIYGEPAGCFTRITMVTYTEMSLCRYGSLVSVCSSVCL